MSVPLDIDYKNIVDWMSQRHKVNADWSKKLKAAKLKVQQLLNDKDLIPEKSVVDYLQEHLDNFSYANFQKALELYKKSESGQNKTFWGGYQDKVLGEWNALDKFFQKGNLHIVDLAKIVSQDVQYEIPSMQKTISTSETQIQAAQQKITDSNSTIKQLQQEYERNCKKMGIQGENLKEEVPQMVKKLPEMYDSIVEELKKEDIQTILQYYYKFIAYVNSKQDMSKVKLNVIEYMNQFGDDSLEVYELRKNDKDAEIPSNLQKKNENRYKFYEQFGKEDKPVEIGGGIDWSSFQISCEGSGQQAQNSTDNQQEAAAGINWGISIDAAGTNNDDKQQQEEVQEIKWDITNTTTEEKQQQEEEKPIEIDWSIIKEDKKQEQEQEEEIDYKQEIFTLISNIETRNQIISELQEIYAFLKQRCQESQSHSTNSLLQMYDNSEASSGLFDRDTSTLTGQRDLIKNIIDLMTDYKLRQLLIIKEQPKSQERIINHLNTFKENIKKQEKNVQQLEKKIKEITSLAADQKKKLKQQGKATLELKTLIESHMTTLMKNKVRLIGDINKLKKL